MKQSEAKEFWPLIKAWSEGATLEHCNIADEWCEAQNMGFTDPFDRYRIKPTPTPKLRAWKVDEIPIGAAIRPKANSNSRGWFGQIGFVSADGTMQGLGGITAGVQHALTYWEHSTDNGATWKICGVEESQ